MDEPAAASRPVTDALVGGVRLERAGPVGRIVLDRPRKRNALSTHLLALLGDRLDEVAADPDIRVVTVHGEGTVFCAGADTAEFSDSTAELIRGRWTRLGQNVFRSLAELPQTTIAVLAGGAFGGGLELAMHCDFRVASDGIRVGLPEATLGTAPGWSGLNRITEIAGISAARRLALTGQPVTAEQAAALGLLDVVSSDVHGAVDHLVADLLTTTPLAQSIIKRALISGTDPTSLVDSLAGAYLAAAGETSSTSRRTS